MAVMAAVTPKESVPNSLPVLSVNQSTFVGLLKNY